MPQRGMFALNSQPREDNSAWTDVCIVDSDSGSPYRIMSVRTKFFDDEKFVESFTKTLYMMGWYIAKEVHGCDKDQATMHDLDFTRAPKA